MSLYLKLVEELSEEFMNMEPGEKLPSERQLCIDYNVSRTTVRNAIDILCQKSMLTRIQGKGTFVTKQIDKRENLSNYYSFTEQVKKIGKKPKSIILDFHIEKADIKTSENLQIKHEDLVISMTRLRCADDEPMMYEKTFIPYKGFEAISKDLLSKKALYDIFEEDCNRRIIKVNERYSVDKLKPLQAKYLESRKDEASLKIVRRSYDINGEIIEYTTSYAKGDKFYYETSYTP